MEEMERGDVKKAYLYGAENIKCGNESPRMRTRRLLLAFPAKTTTTAEEQRVELFSLNLISKKRCTCAHMCVSVCLKDGTESGQGWRGAGWNSFSYFLWLLEAKDRVGHTFPPFRFPSSLLWLPELSRGKMVFIQIFYALFPFFFGALTTILGRLRKEKSEKFLLKFNVFIAFGGLLLNSFFPFFPGQRKQIFFFHYSLNIAKVIIFFPFFYSFCNSLSTWFIRISATRWDNWNKLCTC